MLAQSRGPQSRTQRFDHQRIRIWMGRSTTGSQRYENNNETYEVSIII
jgi:hypothetical protein